MHSTFFSHASHSDHRPLARSFTYLTLALVVVVAALELGAAFIIPLGICAAVVLMVMARLEGMENRNPAGVETRSGMSRGDGGAFPSAQPEPRERTHGPAVVMDGGSLEHHGSR